MVKEKDCNDNNDNGCRNTIIGVTSAAFPEPDECTDPDKECIQQVRTMCSLDEHPTVFARVTAALTWIKEETKKDEADVYDSKCEKIE